MWYVCLYVCMLVLFMYLCIYVSLYLCMLCIYVCVSRRRVVSFISPARAFRALHVRTVRIVRVPPMRSACRPSLYRACWVETCYLRAEGRQHVAFEEAVSLLC